MAYPNWIRPNSGSLGKIAAQQFFNLDLLAEDSDPITNGTITFSLQAGLLPKGLQLSPTGKIQGNPEATFLLQGVPFKIGRAHV